MTTSSAPHLPAAPLHLALPSAAALEREVRRSEPSRLACSVGVVLALALAVAVAGSPGWAWLLALGAGPLGAAALIRLRSSAHRGRSGAVVAAIGTAVGGLALVVPAGLIALVFWMLSQQHGHW